MGIPWTTEPQNAWLVGQWPEFIDAQNKKATPQFFKDIYNSWHKKWPTVCTDRMIQESDNDLEVALGIAKGKHDVVNFIQF